VDTVYIDVTDSKISLLIHAVVVISAFNLYECVVPLVFSSVSARLLQAAIVRAGVNKQPAKTWPLSDCIN